MKRKDLTGLVFGRLTVQGERVGRKVKCKCKCGQVLFVNQKDLLRKHAQSCGCYRRQCGEKRYTTHGLSHLSEYRIWNDIKKRCFNPKHMHYDKYGGVGIVLADEFRTDFKSFFDHVGRRPSKRHTLDRKDGSKGYERGNLRWATKTEQANNRSTNALYEHEGETLTLAQWARKLRVKAATLWSRINMYKWPLERALKGSIQSTEENPF